MHLRLQPGKIQCPVATGEHALNTFDGIVNDLLVCGSRFFELIRLDILFKLAKQVLHLVCKQACQIPECCSPVYLLGKGFHVHFVHSRITLLLQSQPFALGLCLADFLRIFFSDGQFLLLEGPVFLQIVTHGFRLFPVHVRLRFFPGRGV